MAIISVLHVLNMVASFVVVAGIMWATHSTRVYDGVLIKSGLIGLALGCAANGMHPSLHATLLIVCSMALIALFAATKMLWAKLRNQKPIFYVIED